MNDEKICPFMSRPIAFPNGDLDNFEVPCMGERCRAWGKMHVIDYDHHVDGEDEPCIIIEGCRLIP